MLSFFNANGVDPLYFILQDIAKELRPNTIRAKFGKDKVKNAIHVTDLPEDAPLEIEYFFQLLE